jgi:hypothetical protein
VLEQQALRPTHAQMQFAMALLKLSDNKPVKMAVLWNGRRVTLTKQLFTDIATHFLSDLFGAIKGDIASRSMVDGVCGMANIVTVTS